MLPQNNFNTNSRRKVQNLCIKFTQNCDFNHTSRARYDALTYTMTHYTKLLRVEPIWIESENKFTPLFTHPYNCATLKSKYYRRDNVIKKRSQTIDAYIPLLHGVYYRLPVCHPIKYSISNTISPLSSKGFHCRCYVIYYVFFYLSGQLKVFYIVEFLQISWPIIHNVNNRFLAVVIDCYFCLRS